MKYEMAARRNGLKEKHGPLRHRRPARDDD